MLSKVLSFGLNGIEGYPVVVEADITGGLPHFEVVGLADAAVKEAKERVRAGIKNSGFEYPINRITINLAPADVKKEGPLYDLAMAVAILSATSKVSVNLVKDIVFLGELSLDGSLRKVRGVLPILISARKQGFKKFFIPSENIKEASYISGIKVYAVKDLNEVVLGLNVGSNLKPIEVVDYADWSIEDEKGLDFKDVKGQLAAKRALEIAAAGGHNVLMIGPPGSGKTMLAKCFPSILPNLNFEEALEVTKVHSIAGELDLSKGIIYKRPVRAPHHTASIISLTGGGTSAKPGEISLAHNGVLYLDEMPEYSRHTLESLRQALEDGIITVARIKQTVCYPASFTMIGSMNPCPCGNYGSQTRECTCTPTQIHKYLSKLSGPIMDRIDLHVEVDAISYDELKTKNEGESSSSIKERVSKAKKVQSERFKNSKNHNNAKMSHADTKKYCALDTAGEEMIKMAFDALKLSARAHDRILKVARTIADIEGSENIEALHIAEAIQYRSLDRKYWSR